MANSRTIIIPQYIQEVKLAEHKMKKFWKRGSELPQMYSLMGKSMIPREPYIWKDGKLYNRITKTFVVKNSASAGKPRYLAIAGNQIWGRVHERIRMKIVEAMKEDFRPHLPKSLDLRFPVRIEVEVHTPTKFCNWDVGNLWIYSKVFDDLLKDEGLIPDDNILYVTQSSGMRFIPVDRDEDRKLVFTLTEETDPRILNHVAYSLNKVKITQVFVNLESARAWQKGAGVNLYEIRATGSGKPRTLTINTADQTIDISIGKKKILYGAVKKGLASVFSTLVQKNAEALMSRDFFVLYQQFVNQELIQRGIRVNIYDEGGAKVQVHLPDASV